MKNRRERAKLVRGRKVAALAAYSRAHSVNNCTIPKTDESQLIEIECPWNEKRKLIGTKDTATWDAGKWYKELREAAKKTADEKYKYVNKRKTPWYMLDTRKRFHYEERKTSFGACVSWFRVPSEAAEMYNKTIFHPKGRAWYMEQVVQHKIAKWERKNPCPIKEDVNHPDLFEQEYLVPWKARRECALERIRDFVTSVYDKLHVVGNKVDKENRRMVGHTVAEVKDVDGKGHNVTYPNLKESDQLYKDATKAAQNAMDKDPTIVDCNLLNHSKNQKRPLTQAKRTKSSAHQKIKNLKQRWKLHSAA